MVIDHVSSDALRSRSPLKRRSMKNPRYFMSRTPQGGPCLEESASETEGFGRKWTVRISYFPPFLCGEEHSRRLGKFSFCNALQRTRTCLLMA